MYRKKVKNIFYITSVLLLLSALIFIYRYDILFQFQYAGLNSITCQDCNKKLWVHRVNSIKRYNLLKNKFNGFETDIVFNNFSKSFLVYHPNIQQKDTVSLVDFIKNAETDKKQFWLDTRYVDSSNAREAILTLSKISTVAQIKESCIFELYDIHSAEQFASEGYTVSLNISDNIIAHLEADKLFIKNFEKRLLNVKYISQESNRLPLLKQYFPEKRIILWHLRYVDTFQVSNLELLLNDPQVDIVLINVKTLH